MRVLAPSLDSSNTYIKWVLHNIDEENINHETARTELMRTIEEAIDQAADDYEGTSYSDDMDPIEYENMCADILADGGWKTKMTSASGDQGVDIYAEKNGKSVVLQCKMYSSPVGNKAVQEAYAGMGFMGASMAIVVTNSSYTQSAKQLATSLGVLLLHHDELEDLS